MPDRALAALDAFRSARIEADRLEALVISRAEEIERDAKNPIISDAEIERTIDRRLGLLREEFRRAANRGLTPAPDDDP